MIDADDRAVTEQDDDMPSVVGTARRRPLSPISRETLHDRVYAELRRSLIHGAFATGEMLRIQELAERLQTSTMPVREALARLVSEQALEALPNRSVRVPVITRERLEDLGKWDDVTAILFQPENQAILLKMLTLSEGIDPQDPVARTLIQAVGADPDIILAVP